MRTLRFAASRTIWIGVLAAIPAFANGAAPTAQDAYIFGRAVDEAGEPVVGATAKALRSTLETLPGMLEQRVNDDTYVFATTETDVSGKFRLEVPLDGLFGVRAEKGTELISEIQFPVHPSETLEIKLLPSRELRGAVVQETTSGDSSPVRDARVDLIVIPEGPPARMPRGAIVRWMRVIHTTRTAPDGSFSLVIPTNRSSVIDVATPATRKQEVLAPGLEGELNIVLPPPPILHGLVREAGTRRPVEGAFVCWGYASSGFPVTRSGADGKFSLPSPFPTGYLQVVPRGHERAFLENVFPGNTPKTPAVIEVQRGISLSTRVLRVDGTPLAGARVFFTGPHWANGTEYGGITWWQQLDTNGELNLGCLQRGSVVSGFVEIDGAFTRFLRVLPEEPIDLGDVTARVDAKVVGSVLDPSGAPVGGATVLLMPRMPDDAPRLLASAPYDQRYVLTDHAGRFQIGQLAPGSYWLAACSLEGAPGFADAHASSDPQNVTIQLQKGGVVSGSVRTANGAPVAEASINLYDYNADIDSQRFGLRSSYDCATDARGNFICRGVPLGGDFLLRVSAEVGGELVNGELERRLEAGNTGVVVTLDG